MHALHRHKHTSIMIWSYSKCDKLTVVERVSATRRIGASLGLEMEKGTNHKVVFTTLTNRNWNSAVGSRCTYGAFERPMFRVSHVQLAFMVKGGPFNSARLYSETYASGCTPF